MSLWSVSWFLFQVLGGSLFIFLAIPLIRALFGKRSTRNHVTVLVLGDVGRSPRTALHALSLTSLPDTHVSLVGFKGEPCIEAVETSPNIRQYLMSPLFRKVNRRYFLLYAPLKVIIQTVQLLLLLLYTVPQPSAVLVQNPPSIPALAAVWLTCRLRRAWMVIDWHNFGYTVLGLSLHPLHPLVTVSKLYERVFGRCADRSICVTKAMSTWLWENWGVRASVVYDKAPESFHPTSPAEKHELFTRLADEFPVGDAEREEECRDGGSITPFTRGTEASGGVGAALRSDRPAMLLSSTSWTPDEDFRLLFDALVRYDEVASLRRSRYPDVVVAVTGKGPQRAMYEQKLKEMSLKRVTVKTLWLEAEDYPLIVGSADLGICLHTSTSGLDLPMKVVDMYGCHLPVCAVNFPCLSELVRHDDNGLVFETGEALSQQLLQLLEGFPHNAMLNRLRKGVEKSETLCWSDNWNSTTAPIFIEAAAAARK